MVAKMVGSVGRSCLERVDPSVCGWTRLIREKNCIQVGFDPFWFGASNLN